MASRSSATFLPEKSSPRAAAAALSPVCLAVFCAVCWRPRALPPAFAARLRAVLLPPLLDDDRLVLALRPLDDVERRLEELEDDEPLEELRPRPPDDRLDALRLRPPADPDDELAALREPDPLEDLRALDPLEDLRALDPPELRALDPRELDARELEPRELDDELLDLRALDPRALDPDDFRPPLDDDFFRDEPPPLPEPDSAIALPPLKLGAAYPLGARGTICPAHR
jgi:hypothetical protein